MSNNLLNYVKKACTLKNDAGLSRMLEVAPPVISKIRHGKLNIGASMIVKIMRVTGMTIADVDSHLSESK